jgi:toxin ParE1/3/4
MTWRLRYSDFAEQDLLAIFVYVAPRSSVEVARRFVNRLQDACEVLALNPYQGTQRDDLRPGLRTAGFKRRATILFAINAERNEVIILGILYGGRDLSKVLEER